MIYLVVLLGLFIIYIFIELYTMFLLRKYDSSLIIPFPSVIYMIFTLKIFQKHPGNLLEDLYLYLKNKNLKFGFFSVVLNQHQYVIVDPECIKTVLQTDFQYFTERGFFHNKKVDLLSANLFAIGGEDWRNVRTQLSPAFTSGKLKGIFDTFLQCGYQLDAEISRLHINDKMPGFKELSSCYSINVISSCGFGINNNCFENSSVEFKMQANRIFEMPAFRILKIIVAFGQPALGRLLKIRLFDEETTNFFTNIVKEVVTYRRSTTVSRKDLMQFLVELKDTKTKNPLQIAEITAHAFIFFAAGFETTSTTLTLCLYELSINHEIQNKLRREINQVLQSHDKQVSYEALMEMSYMTQVINETLRKYPPVTYITRVCSKEYKIPNTDIILEKGVQAVIPVYSLHHDSDYYPNPESFDPDRFSNENKRKIPQFAYIPFGEGPRLCIGKKFGILQLKIALTLLLKKFEFSLNKNTKVPLQMKKLSFTLVPQDEIFLDIKKVE